MKTIYLHGILAKKFGRLFKLDVQTPREAAHALACQIPEFKQFMLDSENLGYRFAVFNGKKRNEKTNIGEDKLDFETDSQVIHIVPRVIGRGGRALGWLQVIGGVVLVGAGIFFGSPALIGAGAALMVGGVASLLMPTPQIDKMDDDGNRPNNGFGGAVTTTAQGYPTPLCYGEREVGGFINSGAIIADDQPIAGAVSNTSQDKKRRLFGG